MRGNQLVVDRAIQLYCSGHQVGYLQRYTPSFVAMIAFRSKTFAAVALALGGLLGQVDGCTCGDGIDLCTFIEEAAVIVRATALSR